MDEDKFKNCDGKIDANRLNTNPDDPFIARLTVTGFYEDFFIEFFDSDEVYAFASYDLKSCRLTILPWTEPDTILAVCRFVCNVRDYGHNENNAMRNHSKS